MREPTRLRLIQRVHRHVRGRPMLSCSNQRWMDTRLACGAQPWSYSVRDHGHNLQLTLDSGPEFQRSGTRGPGPVSLQDPHATRQSLSELAGKLTKKRASNQLTPTDHHPWTHRPSTRTTTCPAGFHKLEPVNALSRRESNPNKPTAVAQEKKRKLTLDSQNRPSEEPGTKSDYHYDYKFLTFNN